MWLALVVFLGLGATVLRLVPPRGTRSSSAESTFWQSTTWRERRNLRTLLRQLPLGASTIGSPELRQALSTSRIAPLGVERIRVVARGPRDLCLIELVDGCVIRLTVFDDRSAQRFAAAWANEPSVGVSLRWIESIGWQCALHRDERRTPEGRGVVASVYGWLAEVDRTPIVSTR